MEITPAKDLLANLSVCSSLEQYRVPYRIYLKKQARHEDNVILKWVAVGVLAFDYEGRILLIQRASTDSMPNKWEIPGGGVDEEDPSILHAAVRELEEESGLKAISVGQQVGKDYVFLTSTGNLVVKFNFIAEIENGKQLERDDKGWIKVKLDPTEHQDHVWATEEEVQRELVDGRKTSFTSKQQKHVVLQAFELRRRQTSTDLETAQASAQTIVG